MNLLEPNMNITILYGKNKEKIEGILPKLI
jgi:hypothetical protein